MDGRLSIPQVFPFMPLWRTRIRPQLAIFWAVMALALLTMSPGIAREPAATSAGVAFEPGEDRPGGAATTDKTPDRSVFSQFSANMSFRRQLDFTVGNGIFKKLWASAPSSTTSSDGLGPLYNARSCQSCHLKDGRGHVPVDDEAPVS